MPLTYEPLPGIICPSCKSNPVESFYWIKNRKVHTEGKQTFAWSPLAQAWVCPTCSMPYQDACEMTGTEPRYRTQKNQTPEWALGNANTKRTTKPKPTIGGVNMKRTAKPKPKSDVLQLSHSQLETWQQCRLKWRFQKIDHLESAPNEALIFGSALHAMLEADGKRIMAGLGTFHDYELLGAFDEVMHDELESGDPHKLIKPDRVIGMRRRAQDIITRYIEKVQPSYKPLAVEQDFSFAIGESIEFRGRIDAITPSSILDWKTASKPWEVDSQHHKDQATAYLIARPEVSRVSFAVFSGEGDSLRFQSLATDRTDSQKAEYLERVKQDASDIRAAVDRDDFPANPGPLCGWCPMLAHCTAGQAWLKMKGRVPQVPVIPQSKIEMKVETSDESDPTR